MAPVYETPEAGLLTPYTAVFIFSLGIFASNFIFNTLIMKRPFEGSTVPLRDYFRELPGSTSRESWEE